MRNSLFFYVFFVFLTVGAVWCIMRRWKRYMKYSNGTYQNAGQKLIFKTELSVTEVILKLQMPEIQDTLYYDFEKKNGIYLTINYICLFDYLFISSQMSAKPYFIGSTGILLLW